MTTTTRKSLARRALTLALGGALAAALAAAPAARAADTSERGPASYAALMKMKPMEAMHMMDGGKKGHVTRAEFMAFHERMFDRMDGDHDGKVTESEWVRKVHTAP